MTVATTESATPATRMSGSIVWEKHTFTGSTRFNGKCRTCKTHHTAMVDRVTETTTRSDMIKEVSRRTTRTEAGQPWIGRMCCGKPVAMKPVKGIRNDEIKCGAKCLSSKGHVCECSCGGKNHGAG